MRTGAASLGKQPFWYQVCFKFMQVNWTGKLGLIPTCHFLRMVVVIYKTVRKDFKRIWDNLVYIQQVIDRKTMQDSEVKGCCVLSSVFMTLFSVCMATVLLIVIGFALHEFDIEYMARALARFLHKF